MSRKNPYAACQLCGTWHLLSDLTGIWLRDNSGNLVSVSFCQNCLKPRLTYIQGFPQLPKQLSLRELLLVTFTIILTVIAILVGIMISGVLGAFLAFAGILCAAGSFSAIAVSRAFENPRP